LPPSWVVRPRRSVRVSRGDSYIVATPLKDGSSNTARMAADTDRIYLRGSWHCRGFLPLLPTTPFLLLAAACFIRSSDRFYQWLIHNKWFGSYIQDYREHRALQFLLLLIAAIGTTYLMSLRTMPRKTEKPEKG